MKKELLAKNLLEKIRITVKRKLQDLHSPDLNNNDIKSLKNTIKNGFVSTYGPYRRLFENKIKSITNAKYVLAVNSGTTALQLSIKVLNLPKNSEILMPSLTFVATANSALYNGLIPHFVDTEQENFGIDFDELDKYLQKNTLLKNKKIINKKTKRHISAIMPVHLFGHAVDCKKLLKVSKKYKLKIIEDAAEALGTKFNNKHLGLFGNIGCLSFNGNKIITTGAGGAILTNKKKLYEKAYYYANIAKKNSHIDLIHDDVGFNFLMPNLNASLGISQINRFYLYLANKRKLFKKYNEVFKNNNFFRIYKDQQFEKSNYWLQTLIIHKSKKQYKNYFIKYLKKNNIGCRPVWKCLHLLKPYKNFPKMKLVNSFKHYQSVINLPSSYNIF